jgi:hypothetical protein
VSELTKTKKVRSGKRGGSIPFVMGRMCVEKEEMRKTKSERDRFERIIQTLWIKYQPQQQESAEQYVGVRACTGSDIVCVSTNLCGGKYGRETRRLVSWWGVER